MKSFTAVSALALFTSVAVAQNATVAADPFASITTQAPFAKCASGPAYRSCDSVLAQRDACTYTEASAAASCSCAYASSRMACNAICTDSQIDLAIDCPKPTSWSVYPGWGSSSATTTKPSASMPTGHGYDCSETWGYSGSWTTKKPKETGKPSSSGYWSKGPMESGKGSWVAGPSGSSSWAYESSKTYESTWATYASGSSSAAKTTPTVAMVTKNAAGRPTGAAAAAVMAIAGVAGALL